MSLTSSSSAAGYVPGLQLKAWVLFDGTTGTVKASSGASAARGSTGAYSITLTPNMPNTDYLVDVKINHPNSGPFQNQSWVAYAKAVGSFGLNTYATATGTDYGLIWVGVFQ